MNSLKLGRLSSAWAVLLISGTALASGASAARDLKDVMSDMGGVAKALSKQMTNRDLNLDSATKVEALRAFVQESLPIEPEKVAAIADKTARKIEFLEYQKSISSLYGLCTELQQNFLVNDNDKAGKTFALIRAEQKKGHDRFRIPE
jgi:hypothetical protein